VSRVDVFVPCYNYGRFLRQCVESVLAQDGVDVRVLILDDSSTDNSEEIGRQLAAEDARVEYRRHPANRGHTATYNEGIDWVGGDYCMLLSADDLLTPGSFARTAKLMDAHPGIGLAYGRAIKTSTPDPAFGRQSIDSRYKIIPGQEFFRSVCRDGENVVDTPTAVVRTALQRQLGGYRKELPHTGDMELWLRLALHADVGFIDADQAVYRLHGNNMYLAYRGAQDLLQRLAAVEILLNEYPDRLPDRERLRRTVRRAIALDAYWEASHALDRGDTRAYTSMLDVALRVNPLLRFWPGRWRLGLKRLMGPRMWAAVRPLARRLRGVP
jgi:glycosyltransferase involved in cell wall biosynthesis